jgi:hypothetical protein
MCDESTPLTKGPKEDKEGTEDQESMHPQNNGVKSHIPPAFLSQTQLEQ